MSFYVLVLSVVALLLHGCTVEGLHGGTHGHIVKECMNTVACY